MGHPEPHESNASLLVEIPSVFPPHSEIGFRIVFFSCLLEPIGICCVAIVHQIFHHFQIDNILKKQLGTKKEGKGCQGKKIFDGW